MKEKIDSEFLILIVYIESFEISKDKCRVVATAVERDIDIQYNMEFKEILFAKFRQENNEDEFEVIETVCQRLEESTTLKFMNSSSRSDYWVIEFESGLHQLVICFKDVIITKI
jgi:hypothetical protein